jgi:hypothetical protein
MTTKREYRRTGGTDTTIGDLAAAAAMLATAAATIRADLAEVIVVTELEQRDLDTLMLLGAWDDDTLRLFRQPWRIGTVNPVAFAGESECELLSHPDDRVLRTLRCRTNTPLLVRDAIAEDPHPRSVWRDDVDYAIRAYGDAREQGRGAADALGEVEHLLDQAEGRER